MRDGELRRCRAGDGGDGNFDLHALGLAADRLGLIARERVSHAAAVRAGHAHAVAARQINASIRRLVDGIKIENHLSVAAGVDLAREVDIRRADAVVVVDTGLPQRRTEFAEDRDIRRLGVLLAVARVRLHRAVNAAAAVFERPPVFVRIHIEPPGLPDEFARGRDRKITADVEILFRDESADQHPLFLLFGSRLHRAAVEKGDEKDRREDRSKNQYRFRFTLHAPPPILRRIAEYRSHCIRARSRCG